MENVSYGGWKNCVRLHNTEIELIVTTDVGPRIIRCGFIDRQNFMKEWKEQLGNTGSDEWMIYGGHRLWHAPEAVPRTYFPDNTPVAYSLEGATLKLTQAQEDTTGIVKEIDITLDEEHNHITLVHRLINHNLWDIETAPWCLTVMAPGGRLILPQEEYRPHPDYLLPARPLVLWHYTNMSDPRWIWGEKYIQLRQDPNATTKQKLGLLNTKEWGAYVLNGELLIKRYPYVPNVEYPDMGCNTEMFTNEEMLEFETLAPMTKIPALGGSAELIEHWHLYTLDVSEDEADIDAKVLPLI